MTTTHRLSFGRVEPTGTASDSVGLEQVTIAVDGNILDDASLGASTWRYPWNSGLDADGQVYTVTAQARDVARTTITRTVTVDLLSPSEITPTLAYAGTANMTTVVAPGATVRDGLRPLIDWAAGLDGSGIASYRVGSDSIPTPTLSALTAYAPTATAIMRRRGRGYCVVRARGCARYVRQPGRSNARADLCRRADHT